MIEWIDDKMIELLLDQGIIINRKGGNLEKKLSDLKDTSSMVAI